MSALTFDLIAVAIIAVFAAYGWTSGFLSSMFGLVGAVIGVVIERLTLPLVLRAVGDTHLRFIIGFIYGFVVVILMAMIAQIIGLYLRDRMNLKKSRLSRSGGMICHILLAGVVMWVFFAPLSVQPTSTMGELMRQSKVSSTLQALAPEPAQAIPHLLDAAARTASLQQIDARASQLSGEAPIPDVAMFTDPHVVKARRSVVKIVGDAVDCGRRLEGTGFVYSPGLIATNAHVVAGARTISVNTVKGKFEATPVVFDPLRDIAVLWVPGISTAKLVLPALLPVEDGPTPGAAIAMPGFPNNGPYRITPGRVLEQFILRAPGIYGTTMVERQAYAILGGVSSGNSGGPLLNAEGRYLGMVFGLATDKSNTAYALTIEEMSPVLNKATTTREEVSTGRCLSEHPHS